MVSASLGKILLIVACILGILQGVMFLVGGILAAKDNNKNLNNYDTNNTYSVLGKNAEDFKYYCGGIRLRPDISTGAAGANCPQGYNDMDRGWFKRSYDICKKDEVNKMYGGNIPANIKAAIEGSSICRLKGYKYILIISITCGSGYILSAIVALLASVMGNKLVGFAAGGLYAGFYIAFIVLFSIIWHSVRDFNRNCLNKTCNQIKKRGKKSSIEFLAYSICSFALIFVAIICCFLGASGLGEESESGAASAYKPSRDDKTAERVDDEENKPLKDEHDLPRKPTEISRPAKDTHGVFKVLNSYIADKDNMQDYSNKKFDETDTDKSGTITLNEFKEFVNNLMAKRNLPPPTEKKVGNLMKKYDTNKNGTLERNEFQQMLFEIFVESREILVTKYAEKKANSWKPEKVPSRKDTSKVDELDKLLSNTEEFNTVLERTIRQAGYNPKSKFDIDQMTEVLKLFCERYRVPVLNRDEITEVMFDMDRDITEYATQDQRMAAQVALTISRNLLK